MAVIKENNQHDDFDRVQFILLQKYQTIGKSSTARFVILLKKTSSNFALFLRNRGALCS